jgi:hypothetical protein
MFTASAGQRYLLGFPGGIFFVAIPHLSLPYTHNEAEKKRGIEIFLRISCDASESPRGRQGRWRRLFVPY